MTLRTLGNSQKVDADQFAFGVFQAQGTLVAQVGHERMADDIAFHVINEDIGVLPIPYTSFIELR